MAYDDVWRQRGQFLLLTISPVSRTLWAMARKLRVKYPGAIYHVMNRGDRREPIFRDEADYRRFIETLGEACMKAAWQVHAYCLMLNHFHLVVEGRLADQRFPSGFNR